MATISKSVRAGIAAMLTGALEVPAAPNGAAADAGNGYKGTMNPDILLARSGYIVVAG